MRPYRNPRCRLDSPVGLRLWGGSSLGAGGLRRGWSTETCAVLRGARGGPVFCQGFPSVLELTCLRTWGGLDVFVGCAAFSVESLKLLGSSRKCWPRTSALPPRFLGWWLGRKTCLHRNACSPSHLLHGLGQRKSLNFRFLACKMGVSVPLAYRVVRVKFEISRKSQHSTWPLIGAP